jgi:hypothetical protein
MSNVGFDPRDPTQRRFTGYALAGYPDPRDGALDAYVAELRTGGSAAVTNALAIASDKGRQVLRSYGERAASRGVRDRDRDVLVQGLISMVVGGLDHNALEALMRMALLEDACRRLDLEPADVFETVAEVVGHPGSVNLMVWLNRAPEDRTVECMGFEATGSGSDFRYRWTA